jgi:uncharacterized protein (TIGR02246 family)
MQEPVMVQTIPAQIARYFQASNDRNPDSAAATFAEMATVVDEGRSHVGRPAIRAWLVAVFGKYGVTATVSEVTRQGEDYRVAALVAGNFPGSPATLHYDFKLADEQIARLSIG